VSRPSAGSARRHIHEADVVRVLAFASVIAVHVTTHVNGQDPAGNAVVTLLHYSREVFFCLTGFVLAHQYFGRAYSLRRFWARRYLTIGVPYLVWTVIYTVMDWNLAGFHGSAWHWAQQFGSYLVYGKAWFHLYFLVVSLQLYLLWPLISALLRVTKGHHVALLVLSGALELVTMWFIRFDPTSSGLLGRFFRHDDALFATYQFYVLLGAVAAIHRERLVAWVRRRPGPVVLALLCCATLDLVWYARQLVDGLAPISAAAVLQPVTVPWSVAVVAGMFTLGVWWSRRRRPGSVADRLLAFGSDRSFGIFLVHPLVLWFVGRYRDELGFGGLSRHPRTVVVYVLTVLGATAATEFARRSPASLALTGRTPPVRLRRPLARTNAPTERQAVARSREEAAH